MSQKVKKFLTEKAFRETDESKRGRVVIVDQALSEVQPK
jgi:hypothetical protein